MNRQIKHFSVLVLLIALSSCVGPFKRDRGTFRGDWSGDGQRGWNEVVGSLNARGISVRSPNTITTRYETAHGTLGHGPNRFPYQNRWNIQAGGWYVGTCNGSGTATVVRESNGFSNYQIKIHEIAHGVDQHARCLGGHPIYIHAPHWPYWRQTVATLTVDVRVATLEYDIDGHHVCIIVVEDPWKVDALSREELHEQGRGFAQELVDAYK